MVEHVKAPLSLAPRSHPTLLQQIPIDVRAGDAPITRERDADELAETGRVVVALSLRVTERFEDRIRLEDLAFEKA